MASRAKAKTGEHRPKNWRRWLNLVTIALITVMTVSVIAGFFALQNYQAQLQELRQSARQTRSARQVLMETHVVVMDGLARSRVHSMNFAGSLARLDAQTNADFPKLVTLDGKYTETASLLDQIKSTWSRIVAALESDQPGIAKTIYETERLSTAISALTTGIHLDLQGREAAQETLQNNILALNGLILALQILTGIICVGAFSFAAISRTRESRARWQTVNEATAHRERVTRLFEMTDVLQSANDHADANAVLRAAAAELLPELGGALYVFNNSRDRLVLSTSWGLARETKLPDAIGLQQCWALKRGKRHINRPNSTSLCCEHDIGQHDTLEIPMIARGEILGLLQFSAPTNAPEDTLERASELATAIADAMSLALANIALRDKLRSQALRDPLTGLYNRRYMEDALQRAAGLAERDGQKLSVIMIDLDHFKRLNDQFGHAKGDSVLRDAAAVLLHRLRETDIACRYGGEELLVVMPNCDADAASLKAEQLRQGIQALSEPNGAQVSASLGVATLAGGPTSIRDFLAAADAALYKAKQEGRNRVVLAGQAATDTPPLSEENPKPLPALKRRKRKPVPAA